MAYKEKDTKKWTAQWFETNARGEKKKRRKRGFETKREALEYERQKKLNNSRSTISFHLSMRYAETHPDAKVLVIDLCPQANSSMMLLGGGALGDERVVELCSREIPKSVVGYVSTVITNGRGANLPNPYDFLIHVSDYNKGAPDNLYLLCGDGNMEPMAPAINEAASAKALTPNAQPWKWIIEIFKNFILNIADSQDDWMFFVDTNPSFSIYTQMAIAAVERLLTPINADDSSKTAASAMIALLHGTNPPHPIYGSWTFAEVAKQRNVKIPQIHLLIGNRLTQFEGPAAAFAALSDATATALYDIYQKNPSWQSRALRAVQEGQRNGISGWNRKSRSFQRSWSGMMCNGNIWEHTTSICRYLILRSRSDRKRLHSWNRHFQIIKWN